VVEKHFHGRPAELQIPPLRSPDFLWNLVALMDFMRPSLRKGAHAALSSAAWQEIRVHFGRDDTSVLVEGLRDSVDQLPDSGQMMIVVFGDEI
jgi:hypothetical protein